MGGRFRHQMGSQGSKEGGRCPHEKSLTALFRSALATCLLFAVVPILLAQGHEEKILSSDNAYNPIPSPDGKLIAYVRTGWGRKGGSGGFGRSNLVSEVMVADSDGKPVKSILIADAFLGGWLPDESGLLTYRDWKFSLVKLSGEVAAQGQLKYKEDDVPPERVSYLTKMKTFGWSRSGHNNDTIIETSNGTIATHRGWIGEHVVPSPDGRYLAVFGAGARTNLFVYDLDQERWSELGPLTIHPDSNWDYIKPTWNPWFADSSRLAYISDSKLVISEPHGKSKTIFSAPENCGLASPSRDGRAVAFVTFEPRPTKARADLNFYGGTIIWVQPLDAGAKAYAVTQKSADTTFDLRWVNERELVFDRMEDTVLGPKSRLWKVSIDGNSPARSAEHN